MGFLGSFVSLKYEVDFGRFAVETSDILTEVQKDKSLKELDEYEMKLYVQAYALIFLAIVFLVSATGLLIKRKKFLK